MTNIAIAQEKKGRVFAVERRCLLPAVVSMARVYTTIPPIVVALGGVVWPDCVAFSISQLDRLYRVALFQSFRCRVFALVPSVVFVGIRTSLPIARVFTAIAGIIATLQAVANAVVAPAIFLAFYRTHVEVQHCWI
jgi:hypothetical protein